MPTPASFDYAILRVVPRVERRSSSTPACWRFCLEKDYLAARIRLNRERLKALWPEIDADQASDHLDAILRDLRGDPAAGPIAQLSRRERFHWMVSPRSTVIQTSPVHTGVCTATEDLLDRLAEAVSVVVVRRSGIRGRYCFAAVLSSSPSSWTSAELVSLTIA